MQYSCQVMGKCFPFAIGILGRLSLGARVCVLECVVSSLSLYCVQRTEIQVGNRKGAFFSEILRRS